MNITSRSKSERGRQLSPFNLGPNEIWWKWALKGFNDSHAHRHHTSTRGAVGLK